MVTDADTKIISWLSQVSPADFHQLRINKTHLTVTCTHDIAAETLWSTHELIEPLGCEIYYGGQIYASTLIAQRLSLDSSISNNRDKSMILAEMHSTWAKANQALLNAYACNSTTYVYSGDAETGFRHLAVLPHLTPRRLNKPIEELLANGGQSVRYLDEEIALPRERAIRLAVETKETASVDYEHYWNGFRWQFRNLAIPVGDNEVLLVVQDLADWQPKAWMAAL